MRRSGSCPSLRGFTLLELSFALAVSGVLVALLVGVWIQVFRTSAAVSQEALRLRERRARLQDLQGILDGAQWTATSLAPQGGMAWSGAEGRIQLWSRDSRGGSPGPVLWTLDWQVPSGLQSRWQDPQGGTTGELARDAEEPVELRLEALEELVSPEGEELRWVRIQDWMPGLPFRPLGLRLGVRFEDGERRWLTRAA